MIIIIYRKSADRDTKKEHRKILMVSALVSETTIIASDIVALRDERKNTCFVDIPVKGLRTIFLNILSLLSIKL